MMKTYGWHALTLSILAAFMVGCAPPVEQAIPKPKWSAYWQRQHKGVVVATARVKLELQASIKTPNEQVISLSLAISNESKDDIATTLAHEWHGGEWPPTDLYASVTPQGAETTKEFHPVYLTGDDQNATRVTIVRPGGSVTINVRMDWPGTGSCIAVPLMDTSVSRSYRVSVLLVFHSDGRKQYVIGPETLVELNE